MDITDVTTKLGMAMLALVFIYPIYVMSKALNENYKLMKDKLKNVERRLIRQTAQKIYLCHKLRDELENRYRRSIIAATLKTTIEEAKAAELRKISCAYSRETILQGVKELSGSLDPLMNTFTPTFQPLQNKLHSTLKDSAIYNAQETLTIGDSNLVKRGTTTQTKMCKAVEAKSKTQFVKDRKRKHLQQKLKNPVVKQNIKSQLTELKSPTEKKENGTFLYNANMLYLQKTNLLKTKSCKKSEIDQRSLIYSVQSFPTVSTPNCKACKRSFSDFNFENAKENNHQLRMKKRYQHSCSNQPKFESKTSTLPSMKVHLKDVNRFLNSKMNLVKGNTTLDPSLIRVRSEPNCGILVDFVRSDHNIEEAVSNKLIVKTKKRKTIMIHSILEETLQPVNFKRCHISMNPNLVGLGKLNTRAFKIVVKLKKSFILLKFNLYFISKKKKGGFQNSVFKTQRKSSFIEKQTRISDANAHQLPLQQTHLHEKFHKKRHNLLTHNTNLIKKENVSKFEKNLETGEQLAEGDFGSLNTNEMVKRYLIQQNHNKKDEIPYPLEFFTEEEINKAILKQCIGLSRDGFMEASTFCEYIPEIMFYLNNERKLSTIFEEPSEETNEFDHKQISRDITQSLPQGMIVEDKYSVYENCTYTYSENFECRDSDKQYLDNEGNVIAIFDDTDALDMTSSSEEQVIPDHSQSVVSGLEVSTANNIPVIDYTVRLTSSKRNMMLYFEDEKLLTLGEFSGSKTLDDFGNSHKMSNFSHKSEIMPHLSGKTCLSVQTLFKNDRSLYEAKEMHLTQQQHSISQNYNLSQSLAENFCDFSQYNADYLNTLKLCFDIKKCSEKYIESPIGGLFSGIENYDVLDSGVNSFENHPALTFCNSRTLIEHPDVKNNDATQGKHHIIVEEIQTGNSLYMSKTMILDQGEYEVGYEENCHTEAPTIVVEGTIVGTIQDEMEIKNYFIDDNQ